MVLDKIKEVFEKLTNPYYQSANTRWHLPADETLQIAKYIKSNEKIIKPYFNTSNRDTIDKILDSIEQFARLKGSPINLHTTSQYFDMLENLDKTIEKIKKGFFNSLPTYNNVAKPNNYYMEIAFGIDGDPKKQKETLIDILRNTIGNIGARGYPISYYNGTANSPIQYYIEFDKDKTYIRIFINRSSIPSHIVGYLLYELNNVKGKESIIPPSRNMNYYIIRNEKGIINNRIGTDQDPNDVNNRYIQSALLQYRFLYEFF
jgi:hypothetical protein